MRIQQKILREETISGDHFMKSSLTAGVANAWREGEIRGREPVGESFIHANGSNKEGFTDYRDVLEAELMGFGAWLDVESRLEDEVSSLDY